MDASAAEGPVSLRPLGMFAPNTRSAEKVLVVAQLPDRAPFKLPIASIPVVPLMGKECRGLKVRGRF